MWDWFAPRVISQLASKRVSIIALLYEECVPDITNTILKLALKETHHDWYRKLLQKYYRAISEFFIPLRKIIFLYCSTLQVALFT